MIGSMRLSVLADTLPGELYGKDIEFYHVSTDTRSVADGDCFIALKGEHFNAHHFLQNAKAAGAIAAVVENHNTELNWPQLTVVDTTKALGDLGRLNRERFTGTLIGLTGSCGKTTVKEMLATILSRQGCVHATRGNLNNHIGVPLTLLDLSDQHTHAVIEMGASGMGEIEYLSGLAEPTVALVNNVMPAHLEGFGSEAGVAKEKSKIYAGLRQNGVAVFNLDVEYSQEWIKALQASRPDVKLITFSTIHSTADIVAQDIQLMANGCYQFILCAGKVQTEVKLGVMGRQNVANALAAAACAIAADVSPENIATGLAHVQPVKGRLVPMHGVNDSLVIDDTYNANPGSVTAAADILLDMQCAGRKAWLVLGDLGELGDDAKQILMNLGNALANKGLIGLLTCGDLSRWVHQAYCEAKQPQSVAQHFDTQQALAAYLQKNLTNNTVVLMKGSRSARMESVVQAIASGGEQ